jgi:hypothetical protein
MSHMLGPIILLAEPIELNFIRNEIQFVWVPLSCPLIEVNLLTGNIFQWVDVVLLFLALVQ